MCAQSDWQLLNWFSSQAKPLDRQTFMYDFRETSSSTHQSVVKKVQKADFNATTFDHSGGTSGALCPFCCTSCLLPEVGCISLVLPFKTGKAK